jgi:hypothetical protein
MGNNSSTRTLPDGMFLTNKSIVLSFSFANGCGPIDAPQTEAPKIELSALHLYRQLWLVETLDFSSLWTLWYLPIKTIARQKDSSPSLG